MNSCTFGPGLPDTCLSSTHAASPWSWLGTETPLWAYLATVLLVLLVSASASWVKAHYEISGRRPARRWYGTGAWVTLRRDAGPRTPDRYAVLAWDDEAVPVPWLLVTCIDDEDSEAFWAAVTDFDPHALCRFRPRLWRGWLPVLFARETLPCPRRAS